MQVLDVHGECKIDDVWGGSKSKRKTTEIPDPACLFANVTRRALAYLLVDFAIKRQQMSLVRSGRITILL
jgi:hypothetical protein